MPWTDGESLVPLAMDGGTRTAPVLMEYAAEGSDAPLVAIREGQWKVHPLRARPRLSCSISTPTPHELTNLAHRPGHADRCRLHGAGPRPLGHGRL
jgi:choline-sulfatase